jgi:phage baseplate assembly protein gpV
MSDTRALWLVRCQQAAANWLRRLATRVDDPRALHRFSPDEHGECVVMLDGSTWTASDPIICRRSQEEHVR